MSNFKFECLQLTIPENKIHILELMKKESILPLQDRKFEDTDETYYQVFVLVN